MIALGVVAIFAMNSDLLAHSGGTDRNGCHAGKKPYHCHGGGSKAKEPSRYTEPIIPKSKSTPSISERATTPTVKRVTQPQHPPTKTAEPLITGEVPSPLPVEPVPQRELFKYDGQKYRYDPLNPFKPRLK